MQWLCNVSGMAHGNSLQVTMRKTSSAIELIISVMQSEFTFYYICSLIEMTFYGEGKSHLSRSLKITRDSRSRNSRNLDHLSQNSIALFNLLESSCSNFITSSFVRSALHHAFVDSRTLEIEWCCISDALKLVGIEKSKASQ